jgi:hypothetical protein
MECAALTNLPADIADAVNMFVMANMIMLFAVILTYDIFKTGLNKLNWWLDRKAESGRKKNETGKENGRMLRNQE